MYYITQNNNNSIHNLVPDLIIPIYVKAVLELGFKFNFANKPNLNWIKASFNEAQRKIAWKAFFLKNPTNADELTEVDKIRFKFRKTSKINQLFHSEEEKIIFPNSNSDDQFITNLCNSVRINRIHHILIRKFKIFVIENDVIIKQADKNAGICIMRRKDYNDEVYRQLDNESIYRPTTRSDYHFKTLDFFDKVKYYDKFFPNVNLKSFVNFENFSPCNFYILPKIHKEFVNFPIGRPISSTKFSINQGISMLLDKILQPIIPLLPDVIVDTNHLLLLLDNLILNPSKQYILLVADIQSMYTELPINICKNHVTHTYNQYLQQNSGFTIPQLTKLLNLSLDYSFIEFNNQLFIQHRGIQMGNCSSVNIANITACQELNKLWRDEIIFKSRYIDDIFCIIDTTNISNIKEWVDNTFNHNFLKFDITFDTQKVNYLDLTIILNNNEISTSCYSKPMNKHKFVHYKSNHPRHMLNNLPYACGLRMINIHSDNTLAISSISNIFDDFCNRGYPIDILNKQFDKLLKINRKCLLKPKSILLKSHLHFNNPDILGKYGIDFIPNGQESYTNPHTFITFPFYRVPNLRNTILTYFNDKLNNYFGHKNYNNDIKIQLGFFIPDSLQRINRTLG